VKVISRSWNPDPKNRPSFDEIFEIFQVHGAAFFDDESVSEVRKYLDRIRSADDDQGQDLPSSPADPSPLARDPNLWKSKSQPGSLYERRAPLYHFDTGSYWSGALASDGSEWLLRVSASWQDPDEPEFRAKLSDWIAVKHPHLAQIVAILDATSREEERFTLVFEPAFACTLEGLLDAKDAHPSGLWTNPVKTQIILGVALAMEYLHSQELGHGSLSPDTVILDGTGFPLITDLASALGQRACLTADPSSVFTVVYRSPEDAKGEAGLTADVYSFGVLLYEVITGERFCEGIRDPLRTTPFALLMRIIAGSRPTLPTEMHPLIKSLITTCWGQEERRPTFAEILRLLAKGNYPFFPDVPPSFAADFVANVRSQTGQPTATAGASPSIPPPEISRADRTSLRPSLPPTVPDSGPVGASPDEFERLASEVSPVIVDFSRYIMVKELGRGGVGVVHLMRDADGLEVAVKVIFGSLAYDRARFMREVRCLALQHPCVPRLIGYTPPGGGLDSSAKIGTEYLPGGSLDTVLERSRQNNGPPFWNPTGKAIVIVGVALGVQFLHSKDIIHRDLKPSNILLDEKGYPRITDFGSVRSTLEPTAPSNAPATAGYAAPEQTNGDGPHTPKTDVWSYGLIIYEILVGVPVFSSTRGGSRAQAFDLQMQSVGPNRPRIPAEVHSSIKSLIERSWSLQPDERPTIDEILSDFEANDYPFSDDVKVRAAVKHYVAQVKADASANRSRAQT
jgi:serine/threonine protein kinase